MILKTLGVTSVRLLPAAILAALVVAGPLQGGATIPASAATQGGCQAVTLEAPQQTEVGQTLELTASSDCGGSASYAFFARDSGQGAWTLERGWGGPSLAIAVGDSWMLGSWQFLAWATDGPLTVPQGQAAATVQVGYPGQCSSVSLTAQPQGGDYLGDRIELTAQASCGSPASYAFFDRTAASAPWTLIRGWGGAELSQPTSAAHLQSDYQFLVWASDGPQTVPQAQSQAAVTLSAPAACGSVSLASSTAYPGAGQSVSLTAAGSCPTGSSAEYAYFTRPAGGDWKLAQGWTGSSWSWTTPATPGVYQVLAWVSDGPYSTPQAQAVATLRVGEPPACTSLQVSAVPPTVSYGKDVTISAASQCPGGSARYTYFVGDSAAGPWSLADAWTGARWEWNPGQDNPGTYYVLVWVSDGPYTTPQLQQALQVSVEDPPACTSVSATASPTSSASLGTQVTVSASATCPAGSVVEYSYFTGPTTSGPWTLRSAWSGGSWGWDTASATPGSQYILVWASNGPYTTPQAQTVLPFSLTAPPQSADGNPSADLPPTFYGTCYTDGYGSAACQQAEVQDLDTARSGEGLGPVSWNAQLSALPQAEQLFVEADQERVARGLAAIPGMDPAANSNAAAGAEANGDPDPAQIPGNRAYMGDWAEDYGALGASFDWMYNDGPGSGNIDCTASDMGGCWGHRENILLNISSGEFAAPAGYSWVAGASCVAESSASYFESCSLEWVLIPDSEVQYAFTWAQAVALGA